MSDKNYLIIEHTESQCTLLESDDKKNLFVKGVAMQANILNRNGRIYPKTVLERAVDSYINEFVHKNKAFGECDHPIDGRPTVLLEQASHRIRELTWEGDNVVAKASVLNTPKGQIIKALLEDGWIPTVSSRAIGRVESIDEDDPTNQFGIAHVRVNEAKIMAGFDFVHVQSAPDAIMTGIFESLDDGSYVLVGKNKETNENLVSDNFSEHDNFDQILETFVNSNKYSDLSGLLENFKKVNS